MSAMLRYAMIRELFHIGSFSVSPFGVLMAVAFLTGFLQLRWCTKKLGLGDEEDASALVLAAGIGGIVGAKLYYAILYNDWRLVFSRSGLVWYGGVVVAILGIWWMARRRRLDYWTTADAIAPSLAIGYAIGRIGCFLVGDDYGTPTSLPWGVKFPLGLPEPTTAGHMRSEYDAVIDPEIGDAELVAVHPTQLYESLSALTIWIIGLTLIRRRAPRGVTAMVVYSLLAIERFMVEMVRAKDDRFFGPLTVAQMLSLGALVALAVLWMGWRPAVREAARART